MYSAFVKYCVLFVESIGWTIVLVLAIAMLILLLGTPVEILHYAGIAPHALNRFLVWIMTQ